jgi:hypothetical protein
VGTQSSGVPLVGKEIGACISEKECLKESLVKAHHAEKLCKSDNFSPTSVNYEKVPFSFNYEIW